jgi:Mlc titration factor MtfA (ptsG expression regulator)
MGLVVVLAAMTAILVLEAGLELWDLLRSVLVVAGTH